MQGRFKLPSLTSLQMMASILRADPSAIATYSTNRMSALKDTLQSRVWSAVLVVGIRPRSQGASSENSSGSTPLLTTDQERDQG